jgi:type IVB pilus formation R64 PilN family outer membrane protein
MKRLVIAVCLGGQLVGCSTQMTNSTNDAFRRGQARLASVQQSDVGPRQDSASGATSMVKGIWLGGKTIPFKHDLALPAIFYERKNFLFPKERMTLAQAAERFRDVTGIPVRLAPDVYRTGGQGGASRPAAVPVAPTLPALPGTSAGAAAVVATAAAPSDGVSSGSIVMNETTVPVAMLDHMVAPEGLSWEFKDGVVTVQRFVTRTFVVKSSPGASTFSFSSGKKNASTSGSASGGINTGFSSESTVASEGKSDPLASILALVQGVLTSDGRAIPSTSSGTIVVVDSKDGVERASKIIERENDILTRQANFKVEVLSFTESDDDQSGVDVNGVFSNLSKFGGTLMAPTSVVSSTAGALGLNVLTGNGRSVSNFDGSRAVVQALSEFGKVATVHNVTVSTRNRTQTPLAIQTQTVYLAQTTPGTASNGGVASSPGLTPGTVTTGFNITLQPNILDSNQISLQMQIGLIDLLDMKTLTSGSGTGQQSIEAPQSGGFEFKQDVFLRPGQTAILSGYERRQVDYNARKLSHDLPYLLGGSFSGKSKRERIFILITPLVVSNAN